jgi:hypothetical protein
MKPVCVFLVLLCIGCGKKGDDTPAAAVPSPAARPSAVPAPAPPASVPVLATTIDEAGTLRADVLELKQTSGGILMLRVAFTNVSPTSIAPGTSQFSDLGQSGGDVGGINLIDPVNKKKYFVLRDAEKKCVCSGYLPRLAAGERTTSWARFPAPPEDVRKISVMIPSFPPMDLVVITR